MKELNSIIRQMTDEFVQKTCLEGRPKIINQKLLDLEKTGFAGTILYPEPKDNQSSFDVPDVGLMEILPNVSLDTINPVV